MASFEVVGDEKDIESIEDLRLRVGNARRKSPTGAVWLRGLTNKKEHELLPSIGREHKYAGKPTTFSENDEEDLLDGFRRYAREYVGWSMRRWEAIILARHHGLPVRLMDWTTNRLTALYFACEFTHSDRLPDGTIWMLIPNDNKRINLLASQKTGPFHTKGIRVIHPMVLARRINVQSSFFTIQENPWKSLDSFENQEFKDDELDILRLIQLTVPAAIKAEMLSELNNLDINRRTLLADLDGVACGLLHDHILRKA